MTSVESSYAYLDRVQLQLLQTSTENLMRISEHRECGERELINFRSSLPPGWGYVPTTVTVILRPKAATRWPGGNVNP